MLDKQILFYRKNRAVFAEMYADKFIVIKDKKVIGVYASHKEAYTETIKNHEVGSFIIENPSKKKVS